MTTVLHGELNYGTEPTWQPLTDIGGDHLAGQFMWMGAVELSDGRRLESYKHSATRRYVHIEADNLTAWTYTADGRYRTVPSLAHALEQAMSPWWEQMNATPDDVAACWSAIARARELAN